MYIVVVGGGKVGSHLVQLTQARGHSVTLIEKNQAKGRALAEQLSVLVLCGDGSKQALLDEAETGRADVFAAVTGSDQDNIIACQVAKKIFGVGRTIARINNPKNEDLVTEFGADVGVSSTRVIGNLIEQELLADELKTLLTFEKGQMVLVQVRVHGGSLAVNQAVVDIASDLPDNTLLVAVLRAGQPIVPKGNTRLLEDDEVIAMTDTGHAGLIERLFTDRAN